MPCFVWAQEYHRSEALARTPKLLKFAYGQVSLADRVFAMCQSLDGYLWIGTERGLVRFDGFSFTLIPEEDFVIFTGAFQAMAEELDRG